MAASRSCVPIGVVGPAELEVIDVLIALGRLSHFLGSGTARVGILARCALWLAPLYGGVLSELSGGLQARGQEGAASEAHVPQADPYPDISPSEYFRGSFCWRGDGRWPAVSVSVRRSLANCFCPSGLRRTTVWL